MRLSHAFLGKVAPHLGFSIWTFSKGAIWRISVQSNLMEEVDFINSLYADVVHILYDVSKLTLKFIFDVEIS